MTVLASLRSPFAILLLLASSACQTKNSSVDLDELYGGAAQRKTIARKAVIVIPGIMGSRLVNGPTKQIVWGAFSREAAKPTNPDSARLVALPMTTDTPLRELTDTVQPAGALATLKVSLFSAFSIQPRAYLQILRVLGAGGYKDQDLSAGPLDINYGEEHYTCFQFSYDWRRSNAENAALLAQFIEEKRAYIESENLKRFGRKGEVKFDLVAHSMGCLVTRYFLRYGEQGMPNSGKPNLTWSGAKNVEKVIMIGPPNSGSLFSLRQLVDGINFGPFTFKYPAAILGTMPSIYELLPRSRHKVLRDSSNQIDLDPLDPKVWLDHEWGLADPKESKTLETLLPTVSSPAERTAIAHAHLTKCLRNANAFHKAIDRPATPPSHLEFHLFAGDATSTPVQAEAKLGKIKYIEFAPGDNTVPRYSALGDERFGTRSTKETFSSPVPWSRVTFLFENHLGLTQSRTFADNILFELLERK